MMRSLGIFATLQKAGVPDLTQQLVRLAEERDIAVRLQPDVAAVIQRGELAADDDAIARSEVLVTLSGDGGVLKAARAAAAHKTPILAVDLGRLGFLSAVRPQELATAFAKLYDGQFEVQERMMLDARVLRPAPAAQDMMQKTMPEHLDLEAMAPGTVVVGGSIGLNDAVVAKSALARILRLSIYVGGDLVAEMRADGLVISTPTGSTAYALSAGGPIVHPSVPLLLLCPICAHSLTQRPLVVDANEPIEVHTVWEGEEVPTTTLEAMLTIDGQVGVSLQSGDIVRIHRSPCIARLLHLPEDSFYSRLHQKLRWS